MTTEELRAMMETFDIFDNALLSHAYTSYMRDYELIVEVHTGPAEQGTYSYLFRYCVEAHVRTALRPDSYRRSLDDRFTDYQQWEAAGDELDGFVWGVKWANLYPGWTIMTPSETADRWTNAIGIEFHEVRIESNVYEIMLVFADLVVRKLSDHIDAGINSTYIPLR